MKKYLLMSLVIVMSLSLAGGAWAKKSGCTTIQSGTIYDSSGNVITTGFDEWGYNYQGMMFNGFYCNSSRPETPCEEDDTILLMKWNEAWLSNKDCSGDGLLDRHYGYDSYIGSGAWLTNHMQGTYVDDEGETCHWTYFCKIVAVSDSDYLVDTGQTDEYEEPIRIWYTADGDEIGREIWGAFAIIQEVSNDTCTGEHGVLYRSPVGPGLGKFGPEN